MGAKRPIAVTINDVAAATQVSIRTVSRVINNSPKVGAKTRERVRTAIRELGFRPNSRARALASGRSSLIGVVQSDPNARSMGTFQSGIVAQCALHGYELVVHACDATQADLPSDIEAFVRRSRVDGLLLLPPVSEHADIADLLAAVGVPAATICSVRLPGYPVTVLSCERWVAGEVADHLVALGHRDIAIITGPRNYASSIERETGFREGLLRAGIELGPERAVPGDYSFQSGLQAAKQLLSASPRPTAIFATNDNMAAGVLKMATQMGVRVPEDLSVIGFDDADFAQMLSPALTTVRRPIRDMGKNAAELLIGLISRSPGVADIHVQLQLIVRDSTAPPPAGL